MTADPWQRGWELFRAGRYFETHEEWELVWRAAPPEDRDFYQGMVHLTVALYQAGRGNQQAARSQLAKARRRLGRYPPSYHGVPLATMIPEVQQAVEQRLSEVVK